MQGPLEPPSFPLSLYSPPLAGSGFSLSCGLLASGDPEGRRETRRREKVFFFFFFGTEVWVWLGRMDGSNRRGEEKMICPRVGLPFLGCMKSDKNTFVKKK